MSNFRKLSWFFVIFLLEGFFCFPSYSYGYDGLGIEEYALTPEEKREQEALLRFGKQEEISYEDGVVSINGKTYREAVGKEQGIKSFFLMYQYAQLGDLKAGEELIWTVSLLGTLKFMNPGNLLINLAEYFSNQKIVQEYMTCIVYFFPFVFSRGIDIILPIRAAAREVADEKNREMLASCFFIIFRSLLFFTPLQEIPNVALKNVRFSYQAGQYVANFFVSE